MKALQELKSVRYVAVALLFLCAFWIGSTEITWAANAANTGNSGGDNIVQLPDPSIFKPPVNEGATQMSGFIKLFNYIIAIFGVWLLFYAVWGSFKNAKDLIKGASWKGLIMEKFQSLGIGIVVVLIGITGVWYDVLVFIGKVFQAGVHLFTS
nr:hypothetical protein [Aneurinibacillus terranovensis]